MYAGEWFDDKRTGSGCLTWANGDVYEGDFVDGNRTGKGRFAGADGVIYVGDFVDGKRCGLGRCIQYTSLNNEAFMSYFCYDGEWVGDKKDGHGICFEGDFGYEETFKVFEGGWINDKRQGRFVWYRTNSLIWHDTNSINEKYVDFYENDIAGGACVPYDESIMTVETGRGAKNAIEESSAKETHYNTAKASRSVNMSERQMVYSNVFGEYKTNPVGTPEKNATYRRNITMMVESIMKKLFKKEAVQSIPEDPMNE